ncbi:DUF305 domain-containing protein [Nocardiopsis alba]|uniref:DUF305 domain-containing protein n=1 Tax=Nocardiopsis alba TaxID=53437 RepID=UPI00364C7AD9
MTFQQRALNRRVPAMIATALATALFAAACGGDDSAPENADTSQSGEQAAEYNQADVHFAQMMIPHHEQAVEMADLADDRAGDEVRELAEEIRAAQGPEIELMEGFLDDWGAEAEHGMDPSDMDGMLSEDQMSELEGSEGDAFDTLFMEYMVLHHEGAVMMAEAELDEGVNEEARALAQEIIDAQEREIELMNDLLGTDGDGDVQEEDGGDGR